MKTELILSGFNPINLSHNADSGILIIYYWDYMIVFTKSETIELRDFLNQLDLTD